jgi:hypothetical protein
MREAVEVYRGVEIYHSNFPPQSGFPEGFEAVVEDWRLMGTLSSVRDQIDKRLDRNGPGSGIFKVDQLDT